MGFHEIRFPTSVSFDSTGGPERHTDIITTANGFEERNSPWKHSRRRYNAGTGIRSLEDIETLIAFFEARHGRLYRFRWKDWTDFKSSAPAASVDYRDQAIGKGDGAKRAFALVKTYRSGAHSYTRPITKPVAGTTRVGVGGVEAHSGVDVHIDTTTGEVMFAQPPPSGKRITAGFEFDVPVRFDSDSLQISLAGFRAGEVPVVPLLELRL